MKSAAEVIEDQALADGVLAEEYLRRKTNLAILSDSDGTFSCGREYFVVEVDKAEHVRVVDAHESYPQARLSIQGPGGELRKGRIISSDYLIISCADDIDPHEPALTPDPIKPDSELVSKPPLVIQEQRVLTREESFPRRGMIWTSNRRKPNFLL